MRYVALFLLICFPTLAFAETCPKTLLNKGTPAPCSGYILSPDVIDEAAKEHKQIGLLQDQLKLKDNDISLRDQKIELLQEDRSKKDTMITNLHTAFLEKDKNENLKLGLAIGGSIIGTALLCIGVAFGIRKVAP